ncbi:hypothetical protein CJ030_MR0G015024 [Morella rubra]|uniref:Uncharacterized protein n=1 Tax=Morella rubra TaxID=262757 RepID=A0A6A1UHK6_9ROSI|nr:hypothetical protein CJ030_MR0G015024 [Morella rubra]
MDPIPALFVYRDDEHDSIGAFYIDYGGRLYSVRNLGNESDYFLQQESCAVCRSSWDLNYQSAHEHEKSNSRSFDGTQPDYDHFVEFVYHFETNEGILKSPLVLRAPKDHSLGRIGFGVYIPAKWFLEQSNNVEGWSYIKASVETRSPDVEIRQSGVRLHYRNTARDLFQSSVHGRGCDLGHYVANCYVRMKKDSPCVLGPFVLCPWNVLGSGGANCLGGTDASTAAVEAEVKAPTGIVAMKTARMEGVVLAESMIGCLLQCLL